MAWLKVLMNTQARIGTWLCAVSSLLSFLPYYGVIFFPFALVGNLLVWLSTLDTQTKLLRGFVPVIVPAIIYIHWFYVLGTTN
jgi:hypothetical protein